MCKKLMFLISLVALLGLANVVSAVEWICPAPSCSFCDPAAWDGGVVPGPGDEATIDCGNGSGDAVIDCDVHVNRLLGPAYEDDDCNQNMYIVSGDIVINDYWRAIYNYTKDCTVEATGGTMTILNSGSSCRLTDDGQDDTYAHYNFGGNFVLDARGRLRAGDNGGNVFITFQDNVVVSVLDYARIGDDGGGFYKFKGNASCNFLGQYETNKTGLELGCRDKGTDLYVQENAEVYLAETLNAGKYYSNPGMVYFSGGTFNCNWFRLNNGTDLDMTGGLLVCREKLTIENGSVAEVTGGEIRIESSSTLEIDSGCNLNVCGTGVVKIKGNVMAAIGAMACDGSGRLTGCGTAAGVVLSFDGTYTNIRGTDAVDPKKAYCPVPANGAAEVQCVTTEVELCWQPGSGVGTRGRHLVYFGTDPVAVMAATSGSPLNVCVNRWDLLCCNVGNLPLWTQHCWRVDEFNQDGTTTKGDLWCFTTGCAAIPGDTNRDCLVNFEDYACVAGTFGDEQFWPEE